MALSQSQIGILVCNVIGIIFYCLVAAYIHFKEPTLSQNMLIAACGVTILFMIINIAISQFVPTEAFENFADNMRRHHHHKKQEAQN